MSAYALPGSFFLPSTAAAPRPQPQEAASPMTSPAVAGGEVPLPAGGVATGSNIGGRLRGAGSDLIVAVKSASVDPMRLIQSLATRRGGGTGSCSSASGGGGSGSGPRCRSMRRRRYGRRGDVEDELGGGAGAGASKPPPPSSSFSAAATSHNDAIQFLLSIDFNGRRYTATRTLPRFVQLRNDLLREVAGRARRASARRTAAAVAASASDTESSDDDDDGAAAIDVSLIPELPPIGEDGPAGGGGGGDGVTTECVAPSSSSFAGRGFTRLQALLNYYCPAMEGWLRQVADVVPPDSSPSLTDFLWEPLGGGGGGHRGGSEEFAEEDEDDDGFTTASDRRGPFRAQGPSQVGSGGGGRTQKISSHSLRTLDSINEDECCEDGEEGEDECNVSMS